MKRGSNKKAQSNYSLTKLKLLSNKKGQFYLFGAMIIIMFIIGFAVVSNYAQRERSIKIYDVKEELDIESGKVLEFGVLRGESITDDFIDEYIEYIGGDKNLYFIYGDSSKIYAKTRAEVGKFRLAESESLITQEIQDTTAQEIGRNLEPGDKIEVTIDGITYPFTIREGENFFFVILQEIEGEQYVITS